MATSTPLPQFGPPEPKYSQQQPSGEYATPSASAPVSGEKQTFEQTFKIEGPKWHDLWAGILVKRQIRQLLGDGDK